MPAVDEGRKRVLLIAASILAARKLAQFEGGKRALLLLARAQVPVKLKGQWPSIVRITG